MENEKIFEPNVQVDMFDEDANKIISNILNCTSIQLRTDKSFLFNLYRLKIFYSEKEIDKDNDKTSSKVKFIFSKHTLRTASINGQIKYIKFYDLCYEVFNLAEKTIKNYLSITNKFIKGIDNSPAGGTIELKYKYSLFESYSLTKILELITLQDWQIENLIKADIINEKSTREDLRAICKRCKELGNSMQEYKKEDFLPKEEDNEKIKAEEPKFNMDSEDYDLYTFKAFSKSSLVLISFDLYNEVRSLRKKIKKMKGGAI